MTSVSEKIDRLTRTGELYEKLEGGAVRCYACAHRCLIKPGRRGICQVRFNQDGELRVPWGYVAAAQVDPIEKKPFSHLLPGSDALTFGMLGCNLHCGFCFPGTTMVITDQGPISLSQAFESASRVLLQPDAELAFPENLKVFTGCNEYRSVRAVFKHAYKGELLVIRPFYLPELRCTPDHKIYATLDPAQKPQPIPASEITQNHYLVVPRWHPNQSSQTLDLSELLGSYEITYKVPWKLSEEELETIRVGTENGQTSRQIAQAIHKSPSYVRAVRSKLAHGRVNEARTAGPMIENGRLRFPNEHRPGLPVSIPLDVHMAQLLGYYCAEGSVVRDLHRPNSLRLQFSFSPKECDLALEVIHLLDICLGIKGRLVVRPTTICVNVSKASAALLFTALCGKGASEKRIPKAIFAATPSVARAFLDAYVKGDGHIFENGKTSATTVSTELAYGIAWLALQSGYLPSLYCKEYSSRVGKIQGRTVNRAQYQYTMVWYENGKQKRNFFQNDENYLIPIRTLSRENFEGNVYNLEVEEIHNYTAGLLLVSNCQNWLTSQTLRDPEAAIGANYIEELSAEQVARYAKSCGASVVVSSYNEPLITSEWAVEVFRQAQKQGLKCAYVSSGNATPEVLKYLSPYLAGYKIDLKTMRDKSYRQLGCVLDHVLDTIKMAHELGLWVEVVTLVIPGFNDSTEELWDAARFLASVSPDIPWHVTGYHPDYKMDNSATPASTLQRAAEIGQEAGLHFVYAGNLPGKVGTYEDTFCPHCSKRVIQRRGYVIQDYCITAEGNCPNCGKKIPGVWTDKPETVRLSGPGFPRRIRLER